MMRSVCATWSRTLIAPIGVENIGATGIFRTEGTIPQCRQSGGRIRHVMWVAPVDRVRGKSRLQWHIPRCWGKAQTSHFGLWL